MFRRNRRKRQAPADNDAKDQVTAPLDPERARMRTFDYAVKLLAAKPRSIGELRERLLERRGTNESLVDDVISKLREYGYLDDEKFALGYASYQTRMKPVGRRRLERDLDLKKISRDTAEDALDKVYAETPEDVLIDRAIEKRVRVRGVPTSRAETKSLFDHLLRLGFPPDLVISKVRNLSPKTSAEDEDL